MQVLAEEPWSFFLLEDEGKLYVDVLVEHGPASFSVTAQLSDEQARAYAQQGVSFISGLAHQIRSDALSGRRRIVHFPQAWQDRATAAVLEWRKARKE